MITISTEGIKSVKSHENRQIRGVLKLSALFEGWCIPEVYRIAEVSEANRWKQRPVKFVGVDWRIDSAKCFHKTARKIHQKIHLES